MLTLRTLTLTNSETTYAPLDSSFIKNSAIVQIMLSSNSDGCSPSHKCVCLGIRGWETLELE